MAAAIARAKCMLGGAAKRILHRGSSMAWDWRRDLLMMFTSPLLLETALGPKHCKKLSSLRGLCGRQNYPDSCGSCFTSVHDSPQLREQLYSHRRPVSLTVVHKCSTAATTAISSSPRSPMAHSAPAGRCQRQWDTAIRRRQFRSCYRDCAPLPMHCLSRQSLLL